MARLASLTCRWLSVAVGGCRCLSAPFGAAARPARRRIVGSPTGSPCSEMKVDIGAPTDVSRVRSVSQAVGPTGTIRLDTNEGCRPEATVDVIRALAAADLGVEPVDQLVAGEDVEGFAPVGSRRSGSAHADQGRLVVRGEPTRTQWNRPRPRRSSGVRTDGGERDARPRRRVGPGPPGRRGPAT